MTAEEFTAALAKAIGADGRPEHSRLASFDAESHALYGITNEAYELWKAQLKTDWAKLAIVPSDWKDNATNRRRMRRKGIPNSQSVQSKV